MLVQSWVGLIVRHYHYVTDLFLLHENFERHLQVSINMIYEFKENLNSTLERH